MDGTDVPKMINYFVAYTDVGKEREHGRGSFAKFVNIPDIHRVLPTWM